MLFWFKSLFSSQLKRITMGVLLAFVTAFAGVSLLMLSGWFITATALAGISIAAGLTLVFDMYLPGSGIRFFALSRTLGRYAERLYNHDTILRLVAVFRLTLFKQLCALSLDQLRKTSDSEWISRLTADLDALDSLLLRFTITPIVLVLIIICATIFTYFVWPTYAVVIGVYLLTCGISITLITIKSTKALSGQNASLLNAMRANVIEHLQGRVELKARMLMQHHERHVLASLTLLETVQTTINNRVANIQLILDVLLMVGTCALAVIALMGVNSNQIDGPVAVMAVLMFVAISELLQVLPAHYKQWGSTAYSANRLLFKPHDKLKASYTSVGLNKNDALRVIIDQHPNIITSHARPIGFSVTGTQTLVITGPSGAGKSTVANIIAGVNNTYPQYNRNVSIVVHRDDKSYKVPSHFLWNKLGYLTQSNSILAGTLAYNLRLGIEKVTDADLWQVLRIVKLDDWAKSLNDGLYSWLGETGSQVSGGQSRRITMARLLLRNPDLVILDEPFNGLDADMAKSIWINMSDWLAKRKVVLLIHEFPHYLLLKTPHNHVDLDS